MNEDLPLAGPDGPDDSAEARAAARPPRPSGERRKRKPDNPIDIVLVHPHAILRTALADLIDSQPDFRVIKQIASCAECTACTHRRTDVVICGLGNTSMCGLAEQGAATRGALAPLRPWIKRRPFIGLVDPINDLEVVALVQFGFSGLVNVAAPVETLYTAIRRVHGGDCFLDEDSQAIVVREASSKRNLHLDLNAPVYTDRDRTVLRLVAAGKTNDEIADTIFVSKATVKKCVNSLFNRLGVTNRIALMMLALALGSMID